MAESSPDSLEARIAVAAQADQAAVDSDDPRTRVVTLRDLLALVAEAGQFGVVAGLARILAAHARKHGLRSVEAGAWIARAEAEVAMGQAEAALTSAQQAALAAQAAPAEEDAAGLLARATQAIGTALRWLGRDREAAAELRRALALGAPASEALRAELALARAKIGEVGADLASELAFFADGSDAYYARAAQLAWVEYLLAAGRIAAAEEAVRPLVARAAEDRDAAFLALRVALEAGTPDLALGAISAHVARDPTWTLGHLGEGAAHELAGRAEPALRAFTRARDVARTAGDTALEAEALTRTAQLLLRLGDVAHARTVARAVLALPAPTRAAAGAYVALAGCFLAEGLVADAVLAFSDAAQVMAGDPGAKAELALLGTLAGLPGAPSAATLNAARDGRYAVYGRLIDADRRAQAGDFAAALGLLSDAVSADRLGGFGLASTIQAVEARVRARLS